jgi:hypothetical protein
MTTLEDALRAALREQVASTPPTSEHAQLAIERATGIRRWRNAGAMLATVLLTAVGISGFVAVQLANRPVNHGADGGPALIQPSIRFPMGTGVDIFAGYTIMTSAGDQVNIDSPQVVVDVQRVPVGWVYRRADGFVDLLQANGHSVRLGLFGSGMVVSSDGTRVATYDDSTLTVEIVSLSTNAIGKVLSTAVPADTEVVGIVGDLVILRQTSVGCCSRYDAWNPHLGSFAPSWTQNVETIYGVRADGQLVGAVRDTTPGPTAGQLCLATLNVLAGGHLTVGGKICDSGLGLQQEGSVSPDGTTLVTGNWDALPPPGAVLLDLAEPTNPARHEICPTGSSTPVWTAHDVALLRDGDRINRCTLASRDMIQLSDSDTTSLAGWGLIGYHG